MPIMVSAEENVYLENPFILPNENQFDPGGGSLNNGRCILMTSPIKDLIVYLFGKK